MALVPVIGRYELGELYLAGASGPEAIAETRPGDDGRFRLDAPGIGLYKVTIELDGRVPRELVLVPLLHAMELPAVDLEHDAGLTVTLTAGGEPVAGRLAAFATDPAINRLAGRPWPIGELGEWARSTFVGAAGDDGVVRLPATGDEKAWALAAVAEGRAPLARVVPRPGRRLALELGAGVRREIAAVDERGAPRAAALLYPDRGVLPLARTDDHGRALLAVPAGAALDLEAIDGDGRGGSLRLEPPASAAPDKAATEIALDEPRIVRGQVVAKTSRDPVAGALVWAGVLPVAAAVTTDGRGEYALRVPAALAADRRTATLRAAAAGYIPAWVDGGPTDTAGPTIVLEAAGGLGGRVTDAGEQGLAGVEIEVSLSEAGLRSGMRMTGPGLRQRRARSSGDGRFHVPGLPAAAGYELRFSKAGFAPAELEVEALEPFAERDDLRVVLYAGRRAVGTVVDESDLPVAGAEVRLVEPEPRRDPRFGFGEEEPPPGHFTDVRGAFAVPDLAAGRYDLKVASPGFGPVSVPGIEIPDGAGDVDLGTVVLPPGVAIEGRVSDAGGQPIAGAEIRAREPDPRPMPPALKSLMLARTPPDAVADAGGRFTVADRRPGERLDLHVAAEGYVAQTVAGVVAPPEEPLAIVLRAASRVSGRVVDGDGEPLEGAAVQARPEGLAGSGGRRFGGFNRALSDADGRFELAGVEPGRLTLAASAEGFQETRLSGLEAPAGGELAGVELVLRAGATVRGSVRTAGGEPVAQAQVTIAPTGGSGRPEGFAMTDGDGRFELPGVGLGRRTLTARDAGSRRATKTLDIEAGTQSVEITFGAGVEVSGRVVGLDGTGVGGARVSLTGVSADWRGGWQEAMSAADGGFTLSGVEAGTYGLQARHPGFADGESEAPFEVASDPVAGLEIRLTAGATLSGRVLGLGVDELAQVTVHAGRQSGRVDFEGSYSIPHLSPGEWMVRAEIPGTGRQALERLVLEEGVSEVTLDLEFGRGHVLTGTVAMGDEVLPAVTVRLYGVSVRYGGSTVTDHRGRFRLEGLEPGNYRLALRGFESGVEHNEEIEVLADADVRVEIGRGRIAGRVRDRAEATPVEGASLRLVPAGGGSPGAPGQWARSDTRGFFSFGAVPAGRWTLAASKAGYADADAAIEMRAGGAVEDVELLLSPARRFTFEVAAATPVHRVYVAFLDAGGRRIAGGPHDVGEGGRVEVTTVPDGSWEMLVAAGDSATASLRVTVPGAAGRVQLTPGGGLRVEVPDLADGLVAAQLRLIAPDGRAHRDAGWGGVVRAEFPLRSGRAAVDNLAPGAWTLAVTAADGRTWSGGAVVAPGETAEATLP